MNNEPVAWMTENGYLITKDENLANIIKEKGEEPIIPLYTHPAKTLTDEEIDKLWHSNEFYEEWTDGSISAIHYNKFARAILRKAQEK